MHFCNLYDALKPEIDVSIFWINIMAAILDFKMAAISNDISVYISACESLRSIKMVAIPMFVIPEILLTPECLWCSWFGLAAPFWISKWLPYVIAYVVKVHVQYVTNLDRVVLEPKEITFVSFKDHLI